MTLKLYERWRSFQPLAYDDIRNPWCWKTKFNAWIAPNAMFSLNTQPSHALPFESSEVNSNIPRTYITQVFYCTQINYNFPHTKIHWYIHYTPIFIYYFHLIRIQSYYSHIKLHIASLFIINSFQYSHY